MKNLFKKKDNDNNNKSIDGSKYRASVTFQIIMMCIFVVFLLWIFYKPAIRFKTYDEYPAISSTTPQQLIKIGGSPAYVDVGLYVRDISKFDIIGGEAIADITVWFFFDPNLISIKSIEKFTFDRAKIIYKSKPFSQITKEKLLVRYDMNVAFSLKLNYESFPLDDHRINFTLTNYFISLSEVVFKSSRINLTLNSKLKLAGWKHVYSNVKTGYLRDELDPYHEAGMKHNPRVIFSFDFARVGFRHSTVIIMPLLLILILALFTWTFDPFAERGLPISITSISAVIMQNFVIERMSPKTGYFMISNYIFLLILICCCIVFLINILGKKIKGFYKNIFAFMIYATLVIFIVSFLKPLF
ncbi:hypothetical protein KAT08_03105 [Candidatus Babeliales bacterium]|nr:hypothetical protein [Candidatus Babeliales bacterium]